MAPSSSRQVADIATKHDLGVLSRDLKRLDARVGVLDVRVGTAERRLLQEIGCALADVWDD